VTAVSEIDRIDRLIGACSLQRHAPDPFERRSPPNRFAPSGYPASGKEVAKLLFWSFVAGFSERLVPQVIGGAAEKIKLNDSEK
jgi:hypothetical protein